MSSMPPSVLRPSWVYSDEPIPDPEGRGARALRFLALIRHPKSPTGRLDLPPFMQRIVHRVYGDRRIRTVFLMLPRGGRKTTVGAALSLLHVTGPERVAGGLAILAAHDRGQARLAFEEAQSVTLATRAVKACTRIRDATHRIEHVSSRAVLHAISSEAGGQHGTTPNFILADELHTWRGAKLWDVLRTGAAKIPGSLLWAITTAGTGQQSTAYDLYSYAKRVQLGEVDDPGFLPLIWEADRNADWQDEAVWHAVNPGLEYGFPDLEGLRQLAREAKERPAQQAAFRQLHLNCWLDQSAQPFVDMQVYDDGAVPVDLERHERDHDPCYLGVDLSSTSDLTAIVAAWPDDNEGYDVACWPFIPAANIHHRGEADAVPYPLWAEQGYITPTPGDVVDYRTVEKTIKDLCLRFNVLEIAFDPHLAKVMMASLAEQGFPAVACRQGYVTQAPAVQELERAILARRLRHGGHPVLREHVARVAIETDRSGNRLFHKGKSKDRIDLATALWMAVGRAHAAETRPSPYERGELQFI